MLAKGPAYALYALMDFIADNYQPVVIAFRDDIRRAGVGNFQRQFSTR